MDENNKHKINCRYLGYGYLLELAVIYLAVNCILWLRLPMNPITLWGVFLLIWSGLVGWLVSRGYPRRQILSYSNIIFISSVILVYVSHYFYDVSFDGQTYHQLAVYHIKNGYNPFHSPSLHKNFYYILAEHYVKASWILESFIYGITTRMEYAKGINLIALMAALFLSYESIRALTQWGSRWMCWGAALILCLNPIVISQLFTFLNDGLLASLLVCYISLIMRAIKVQNRQDMLMSSICLVILVNIKFTGLLYVLLLISILGLYLIEQKSKILLGWLILNSVLALGAATLIFSYNPYITNIREHRNPVYPLMDESGQKGIRENTPAPLRDKPRLEKLYLSLASRVSDRKEGVRLRSVMPWEHTYSEFIPGVGSTRINGLGPFFPLALICSLVIYLYYLNTDKAHRLVWLLCILWFSASILINPECWWMRYVPQLWFIPVLGGIMGMDHSNRSIKLLGGMVGMVLWVNIGLYTCQTVRFQLESTRRIQQTLTSMQGHKILLENDYLFTSVFLRMKENQLRWAPTDERHSLPSDAFEYPYATCRYSLSSPRSPSAEK